MKRTPLYENHCWLGGRMIDFGGWVLPVQYTGIAKEHQQTRTAAGLFDVSHMGEIKVTGDDAEALIQRIVTNDISRQQDGRAVYSPMCGEDGGTVDDLIIYRFGKNDYLLVVNASNTEKDFAWFNAHCKGRVRVEDVSARYAQLALQGPKAQAILQKLCCVPLGEIGFFQFLPDIGIGTVRALVSRTGYTGEDGFEIYAAAQDGPELWEAILAVGEDDGLVPVGLGARDTLRLEAALPLYGHELAADISPLEAGLNRFVALDKENFIGKDALVSGAPKRTLVGFEMLHPGIPREHYDIQRQGKSIGFVTSGSFSPTLKKSIGMALIDADCAEDDFDVVIHHKPVPAQKTLLPFYTKKYKIL